MDRRLYYREWAGRSPKGIPNLGNTCYFNSVMQALLHTRIFSARLQLISSPQLPLTSRFLGVRNSVNFEGCTLDPRLLKEAFDGKVKRFANSEQHDSHECLSHLLDEMRKEERESGEPASERSGRLPAVDSVFGGHFMTVYTCKKCRTPLHVCEPFLNISLPIAGPNVSVEHSETGDCPHVTGTIETETQSERPGNSSVQPAEPGERETEAELPCNVQSAEPNERETEAQLPLNVQPAEPGERETEEELPLNVQPAEPGERETKAELPCNVQLAGPDERETEEELPCNVQSVERNEPPSTRSTSLHQTGYRRAISSMMRPCSGYPLNCRCPERKGPGWLFLSCCSQILRYCFTPVAKFKRNLLTTLSGNVFSKFVIGFVRYGIALPVLILSLVSYLVRCGNGLSSVILEIPGTRFLLSFWNYIMPKNPTASVNRWLSNIFWSSLGIIALPYLFQNFGPSAIRIITYVSSLIWKVPGTGFLPKRWYYIKAQGQSRTASIKSCLRYFTRIEHIDNEYLCNNCYGKQPGKDDEPLTSATKQTLIFNPPAILVIHMKRFELRPTGAVKRNAPVTYEELLDLGPYCSSWCLRNDSACGQGIWYSLYAVVVHTGSLQGGHYYAYVKVRSDDDDDDAREFLQREYFDRDISEARLVQMMKEFGSKPIAEEMKSGKVNKLPPKSNQSTGTWFCMNDSHVYEVDAAEALNQQAYLLFYERIASPPAGAQ